MSIYIYKGEVIFLFRGYESYYKKKKSFSLLMCISILKEEVFYFYFFVVFPNIFDLFDEDCFSMMRLNQNNVN